MDTHTKCPVYRLADTYEIVHSRHERSLRLVRGLEKVRFFGFGHRYALGLEPRRRRKIVFDTSTDLFFTSGLGFSCQDTD